MPATTLSVLKPSVNNLTAPASSSAPPGAGLRGGSTSGARKSTPEFLSKDPALTSTPLLEEGGPCPSGSHVGELRDHAVPVQQAHGAGLVVPDRSGPEGDGGQRDVLSWSERCIRSSPGPPTRPSASLSTPARSGRSRPTTSSRPRPSVTLQAALCRTARGLSTGSSSTASRPSAVTSRRSLRHPRLAATLEFLQAIRLSVPGVDHRVHGGHGERQRWATPTASRPPTCAVS